MEQAKHKLRTNYLQDSIAEMYKGMKNMNRRKSSWEKSLKHHNITKHLISCRAFNDHLIYMYKRNKKINESVPNHVIRPSTISNRCKLLVQVTKEMSTSHYFDTKQERTDFHSEIMELYIKYSARKHKENSKFHNEIIR